MVIKVLAIGDLANNIAVLRKYVKKSEIFLVNFPWTGASTITDEKENVLFIDPNNVVEQLNKINELKDSFDVCLVMSPAGARLAYLADLNYIFYLVGNDIRTPPFIKNVKDPLASDAAIHSHNFLERKFYWDVYQNAKICVASFQNQFNYLKQYRSDGIRLDKMAVDTTIFNKDVKPVARKKNKFTFFSPQKVALQKGYDIIIEALSYCKSDFDIIQVEWFDKRNRKEIEFANNMKKNKPHQIKFVPLMTGKEVAGYYAFSDAVLASVGIGYPEAVDREAIFCNKPVVAFNDPNYVYSLDGKEKKSPFLPMSKDPKELARIIDLVVGSEQFRKELFQKEFEFIKHIGEPYEVAAKWDSLFEEFTRKYKSINRKTSKIKLRFRLIFFLVANRLYTKKLKKIFQ